MYVIAKERRKNPFFSSSLGGTASIGEKIWVGKFSVLVIAIFGGDESRIVGVSFVDGVA